MKELNTTRGLLRYQVHGAGQPVMLVHGFGEDGRVWDGQVSTLQTGYRVMVPELPGTRGSELFAGRPGATTGPDFSMESMAASLHELWIHERSEPGEKLILLGHSMGGYITMAFVEQFGDDLTAYGLIHSSAFADTPEKKETRTKGIRFIRDNGAAAFLNTSSPGMFSEETRQNDPATVNDFMTRFGDFPEASLIAYYEAMMQRPDRSKILQTSGLPVLFVFGKHDAAVRLEDGLKQSHYPEKAYIDVLTHSGHLGMLEEPDRLNEILQDFLAHP